MAQLFQLSLNASFVPRASKETTVIPNPRKPHGKVINDFRPVALTSILCKCTERVVAMKLTTMINENLDPLQFSYEVKQSVEDTNLPDSSGYSG